MQKNNMNTVDFTSKINKDILLDKIYCLQEDFEQSENELTNASIIIDAKDEELNEKDKTIKSLEKEVALLQKKLLNAYEDIISIFRTL